MAAGTAAGMTVPHGGAEPTAHQREVVTSTDPSSLPAAAAVPVPSVSSARRETSLHLPYKSGALPRSRRREFRDAGKMFGSKQ